MTDDAEMPERDDIVDEEQDFEDLVAADFGLSDLRSDTIRAAQTEGLRLTYGAATEMLKDPKTSPLARVACMKIVLDVGRQKANERERQPAPDEETPEEFERRYAEARARMATLDKEEAWRKLQAAKANKTARSTRRPQLFD